MDSLLEATYRAEANHFWFHGLTHFSEPPIRKAVAYVADARILDCAVVSAQSAGARNRDTRPVRAARDGPDHF